MLNLLLKETIKRIGTVKIPIFGPYPRCGHSLFLVETPFGRFIVCSNPTCSYFSKVKRDIS